METSHGFMLSIHKRLTRCLVSSLKERTVIAIHIIFRQTIERYDSEFGGCCDLYRKG
jgi:hypothetical protein